MDTTTREDQEQLVYQAICAIAAHCDGAVSQDGVGFNGGDTKFGRRIATAPFETWTPEIRQEAARILGNTYRVQAQRLTGIDARELDVVREAAEVYTNHTARDQARQIEKRVNAASNRFLKLVHKQLQFQFPYDAALKDELKGLGACWDATNKAWWVSTDRLNKAIVDYAIKYSFQYSDEIDAVLEAGSTVEAPPTPVNDVVVQGDHLLVTLVTKLGGRAFDEYRNLDGYGWIRGSQQSTVDLTARNLAWLVENSFSGVEKVVEALESHEINLSAEAVAQDARIEASKAAKSTLDLSAYCPEGLTPYDYQVAGVEYALEAGSTFIADEMGLGKTIQAILAVKVANSYPALVVCPASLKGNWAKEIAKWDPEHSVEVLSGRKPVGHAADWIVVNYDIVDAWVDALIAERPKALICDESHYIKNPTAKRTKALTRIAAA